MRVVYLANNQTGLQILHRVMIHEELQAIFLHEEHKAHRQFSTSTFKIASRLPSSRVFCGSMVNDPLVIQQIAEFKPDICVSVLFDYILRREFLDIFPMGVINLHPSLLPYNKGQYPNVWSIVDGTPAGVTLHYIDEGIDTGDVIFQKPVPVYSTDTGETLYHRLETAMVDLFVDTWPLIKKGDVRRFPQEKRAGTSHRKKDVDWIDEIDLYRTYYAQELIDVLRARTYPPHKGAYFVDSYGKKVYLKLTLENE